MISRNDIENLARLSRLKLSESELAGLEKDFASILEYVGQLRRIEVGAPTEASGMSTVHNVMREDVAGVIVGGSRETLLDAAPRREGDFVVVRKIIQRDEPSL